MEGRVIAVNAAFSEFPLDLQQLMKSSGVLVVTASQISSDSRVLVGSAAVVYTKKGLGRSKAEELDEMLGYANGVYKKEVFNTQVFVQELSAVLRRSTNEPDPPDPRPTPPLPSNGKPELRLPPQGLKWSLKEFVFNNARTNTPTIDGEVDRLVVLAKQSGYPEATHSGVGQAFRKFRQSNGLSKPRPRRGKLDQAPALVDLGFVELPAVTDFLQDIQKMAQDTHAFVSELQKERAENKKAIEELERRIKILEGQLENAKQAADLLAALRGQ